MMWLFHVDNFSSPFENFRLEYALLCSQHKIQWDAVLFVVSLCGTQNLMGWKLARTNTHTCTNIIILCLVEISGQTLKKKASPLVSACRSDWNPPDTTALSAPHKNFYLGHWCFKLDFFSSHQWRKKANIVFNTFVPCVAACDDLTVSSNQSDHCLVSITSVPPLSPCLSGL